jgi:dolichyl-phosphate-mannose-protein mannosyltransferase
MNRLVRAELIWLSILITACCAINLIWIVQDTRPQPLIDPYSQKTLEFIDGINIHGLSDLPRLLNILAVGPRPPLYQLLAVPSVLIFGRSADSILLVNIFFLAVLLLSTYGIGKLAGNGKVGLLAVLLVATYPPIANLVKIARPHSILPACAALILWLLLLLLDSRSRRIAWLLGLSIGFGVLVHPNMLYFIAFPSLGVGLYMILFRSEPKLPTSIKTFPIWMLDKVREPFVWKGLLPGVILALAIILPWYGLNYSRFLNLIQHSAGHWSKIRVGFNNVPASFWWYALTLPGAISYLFATLLAVSLVVNIIRKQAYPRLLAVLFIIMYAGIAYRKGTLAWMNAAPLLPLAGVLSALLLIEINDLTISPRFPDSIKRLWRFFTGFLLILYIGAGIYIFSVITWGIPAGCTPVTRALGAPLDTACHCRMTVAFCPNPPRAEDWRMSDILQTILDDWGTRKDECSLAVVSTSVENFNQSTLKFHLIRDFPGTDMEINRLERWDGHSQLNWLTSDYLVYIPKFGRGIYSKKVMSFLEDPPSAFSQAHLKLASFSLPNNRTAILIKRTGPLALEEAVTSIKALNISRDLKEELFGRIERMLGRDN